MKVEPVTNNIKVTNNDLETLKIHFPQCFDKDGNFQLEKFKNNLTEKEINFSTESYGLDWLGKSYARLLASDPATTLLKADETHNAKPENANSENLLIKGDNLEVLKHLANAYYEQVKMIYIDPPYNTGSDGFVYNDDRKFTVRELQNLIGVDAEKAKRILDFTKQKSNSHSAWLTFMYPRLYIAKQLLTDDGVIFVSIDENEIAQSRMLMDEIFGEENFVATIIWRGGKRNAAKHISNSHEYILFYANQLSIISKKDIKWKIKKKGLDEIYKLVTKLKKVHKLDYQTISDNLKDWFDNLAESNPIKDHKHYCKVDEKGIYFYDNISRVGGGTYDIKSPLTGNIVKKPSRGWVFGKEEDFWKAYNDGLIVFSPDDTLPSIKSYLHDNEEQILDTVFYKDRRAASISLRQLIGDGIFDFPKDVDVLKEFFGATTDKDSIYLDFFAGSGTTGDAVMQMNAEDGGNRKFILVQWAEEIDPKKNKAAFDFVKEELNAEPTIFEITKERLLRAAKKINADLDEKIKKLKSEIQTEETKAEITQNLKSKTQNSFKIFETTPIWEEYNFEAEQFDPSQTLFDAGKLTEDDIRALLTTWKTYDGIALTQELESIDLSGYTSYYGNGRLYLMHKGFTTDSLKTLLEKIDTDKHFEIKTIIAFGYHFESARLRELAENVKTYNNKKKSDIDFITRY